MAQAQGYKIIGSNILQSMLKSKLQIRENVNKRIRICENLVLFCLSCKKDINSFNRRLKRKIALDMCKNGWALHYVVIEIYDGVQFYLMAKVLAIRMFNRPNNRLYANNNGYAIHNNKGDQVSSIAAIWAIYHHMIMGTPVKSVES